MGQDQDNFKLIFESKRCLFIKKNFNLNRLNVVKKEKSCQFWNQYEKKTNPSDLGFKYNKKYKHLFQVKYSFK